MLFVKDLFDGNDRPCLYEADVAIRVLHKISCDMMELGAREDQPALWRYARNIRTLIHELEDVVEDLLDDEVVYDFDKHEEVWLHDFDS